MVHLRKGNETEVSSCAVREQVYYPHPTSNQLSPCSSSEVLNQTSGPTPLITAPRMLRGARQSERVCVSVILLQSETGVQLHTNPPQEQTLHTPLLHLVLSLVVYIYI